MGQKRWSRCPSGARGHPPLPSASPTARGAGCRVGCESNPQWPPEDDSSPAPDDSSDDASYDRDNWDYDSGAARQRLGCSDTEHVDHIVALKEAYDSGASNWTAARKSEFANDPINQWCLDASLNSSKSDHDLAKWDGGSCSQRRTIARRTQVVKTNYGLTTDPAEDIAIEAALTAWCPGQTDRQSLDFLIVALSLNDCRIQVWNDPAPSTAEEEDEGESIAATLVIVCTLSDRQAVRFASNPIPD